MDTNKDNQTTTLLPEEANAMQQCLQQEIAVLSALAIVLEAERFAIENNDSQQLNTARIDKEKHLAHLEQQGQQQWALLDRARCCEGAAGLDQFIDKVPLSYQSVLRQLRENFKKQLQHCQDYNISNGMILNLRLRNTQTLLPVMRGASTIEGGLYGRNGKNAHD